MTHPDKPTAARELAEAVRAWRSGYGTIEDVHTALSRYDAAREVPVSPVSGHDLLLDETEGFLWGLRDHMATRQGVQEIEAWLVRYAQKRAALRAAGFKSETLRNPQPRPCLCHKPAEEDD